MTPFSRLLALILIGSSVAGAQSSAPQPPEESSTFPARLSDVEGSVRVAQAGRAGAPRQGRTPAPPSDSSFHAAGINTLILAGTQVSTGGDGRAEIEFNDGNIARITPNSSVEVVALPTGGEELRALGGLSYFEAVEGGVGVLTVDAGPDALKLDGASLLRLDLDQPPFKAASLRGTAHVSSLNADTDYDINQGQTAELDPADPSSYDVNDELADVSWDNWNADRDQTLTELAQSQTGARAGSGDASSPGWNDLDYYGTWYNVPGAGMAWAPDGVDQNFDPYGAGTWSYYSGVGYAFASAYPWGWLPYHSGAWSYFPGFGWGWQPGGGGFNGVGWYPYTGVHLGPASYRVPLPLDGRLRTRLTGAPLPPPTALHSPVAVNRAPQYGFRSIGGARPEPRQFPLAGAASNGSAPAFAPTVPVIQPGRAAYRPSTGSAGQLGYRSALAPGFNPGLNSGLNPGAAGQRITTRGPNAITPAPGILPGPRTAIPSPPRVIAPAPVRIAPPPVIAVPRVAAPPAAAAPLAGPRGH